MKSRIQLRLSNFLADFPAYGSRALDGQPLRSPTSFPTLVLVELDQGLGHGLRSNVTSQRTAMRAQVSFVISELPL